FAAEKPAIPHGSDEKPAIGQETDAGRQALGAGIRFNRALDRNRKDAAGVTIREVETAIAPAWALCEREAVKKGSKRRHGEAPQRTDGITCFYQAAGQKWKPPLQI